MNLYVQQQYLLAKLLLISSRARPTSTQISWGQMTFYNSAISNMLMEWRTRTPEVQNTLNIGQIWFGMRCWSNLYMVTFEKTGSPLTIMLSSHIFSPNPRNNPPWECSRRADFCAQTQIRDDFESAPALPLHPRASLALPLSLSDCTTTTKRMLAMRVQTAMEMRYDVTMGLVRSWSILRNRGAKNAPINLKVGELPGKTIKVRLPKVLTWAQWISQVWPKMWLTATFLWKGNMGSMDNWPQRSVNKQ